MGKALTLAALLLASASTARAEGMRCGTHLITEATSLAETVASCGAPATRETRVERRTHRLFGQGGQVILAEYEVVVDLLRYDFGPHQFVYELRFEDGRMAAILQGGYGKAR